MKTLRPEQHQPVHDLTTLLNVTFKAAFAGPQSTTSWVVDKATRTGALPGLGQWTVPGVYFTYSFSPAVGVVEPGGSSNLTLNVSSPNGFAGTVSFTNSAPTNWAPLSFNPATVGVPGASSTTVSGSTSVPAGNYDYVVKATQVGVSAPLTPRRSKLPVQLEPFRLSAGAANPSTVAPGGTTQVPLNVTGAPGFSGTVTFELNAPTGITATYSPNSVIGSGSATADVSVASGVSAGQKSLTFTARSGGFDSSSTVTLQVSGPPPPPPFTFTAVACWSGAFALEVPGPYTLNVNNLTSAATFGLVPYQSTLPLCWLPPGQTSLPSGIIGTFNNLNPAPGNGNVTLTFTAAPKVTTNRYLFAASATSAGQTRYVNLQLDIWNETPVIVSKSTDPATSTATLDARDPDGNLNGLEMTFILENPHRECIYVLNGSGLTLEAGSSTACPAPASLVWQGSFSSCTPVPSNCGHLEIAMVATEGFNGTAAVWVTAHDTSGNSPLEAEYAGTVELPWPPGSPISISGRKKQGANR